MITFLGVTFKPGTDDMREAASLKLIPYLISKGCNVSYYEPTGIKDNFNNDKVKYINNTKEACKKAEGIDKDFRKFALAREDRWGVYMREEVKSFGKGNTFLGDGLEPVWPEEHKG